MAKVWWALLMAATLLGFSACREDAGEPRPLRSLANGAEEKLQALSDELDDAVESGREVARDVSDRVVEAADDAIDAADEAIESAQDSLKKDG